MIKAIEKNLQRGIKLLETISDEQYSNKTIPPYYSSIGANMRHILDAFTCIFNGLDNCCVDFSDRERNQLAEEKTQFGIKYFNDVISQLHSLNAADFDKIISDLLRISRLSSFVKFIFKVLKYSPIAFSPE